MPRYNPDFTKVSASEPAREQIEEHDRLQAEAQAEFHEEAICLADQLDRDFPNLTAAQRDNLLWRRLGFSD